jgi:hypothetical protein
VNDFKVGDLIECVSTSQTDLVLNVGDLAIVVEEKVEGLSMLFPSVGKLIRVHSQRRNQVYITNSARWVLCDDKEKEKTV